MIFECKIWQWISQFLKMSAIFFKRAHFFVIYLIINFHKKSQNIYFDRCCFWCLFLLSLQFFFVMCPNICRRKNKKKNKRKKWPNIEGEREREMEKMNFNCFWYQAVILHTHIFKCVIKGAFTAHIQTDTHKQICSWHSNRDACCNGLFLYLLDAYVWPGEWQHCQQETLIFFRR